MLIASGWTTYSNSKISHFVKCLNVLNILKKLVSWKIFCLEYALVILWNALFHNCTVIYTAWACGTLRAAVLLSASSCGSLSPVVLPTFLCPTERALNCTHPLVRCLYSESRFVVFLAWSNQRMLKTKPKPNTHPHSLWSSPLFLWDLGSGCYDCLHFFLCLPGCLHLFPVSTYLSSMYTINVTHCCTEDKNSPGMSTCRADELFPAPIYSSGCMATSWFNPRHSVPVLSFSQEVIITFAPHFTLFTKLLNDTSPQNHRKPLALDGVHLYLLSPFVYGIAVSFQSAWQVSLSNSIWINFEITILCDTVIKGRSAIQTQSIYSFSFTRECCDSIFKSS